MRGWVGMETAKDWKGSMPNPPNRFGGGSSLDGLRTGMFALVFCPAWASTVWVDDGAVVEDAATGVLDDDRSSGVVSVVRVGDLKGVLESDLGGAGGDDNCSAGNAFDDSPDGPNHGTIGGILGAVGDLVGNDVAIGSDGGLWAGMAGISM
ncbi:uncharacterized protein N7459_005554 [Penicillium hispanicum]|uniref:uncharacterized protein n=1 Tax=Penicillium hispanicum TaxID=1080232 RepID=UPI002541DD63|nr:uncharacterized protein N7459_005554 [Penicillium hispanicum]KAJ5579569.1 hypothetical protein N7459_005554 [Penicillium hispanicum]